MKLLSAKEEQEKSKEGKKKRKDWTEEKRNEGDRRLATVRTRGG